MHEDLRAENVKEHENRQIENDSSDLKILKIKSFASIREPQEYITKKELLKFAFNNLYDKLNLILLIGTLYCQVRGNSN